MAADAQLSWMICTNQRCVSDAASPLFNQKGLLHHLLVTHNNGKMRINQIDIKHNYYQSG